MVNCVHSAGSQQSVRDLKLNFFFFFEVVVGIQQDNLLQTQKPAANMGLLRVAI